MHDTSLYSPSYSPQKQSKKRTDFSAPVRAVADSYSNRYSPRTALLYASDVIHQVTSVVSHETTKLRKKVNNFKHQLREIRDKLQRKTRLISKVGLSRHAAVVPEHEGSRSTRFRRKAHFKSLLTLGKRKLKKNDQLDVIADELESDADMLIQHKKIRPAVIQDYNTRLQKHNNNTLRAVRVLIKQILAGKGRRSRQQSRHDIAFDKQIKINVYGYSYNARAQPMMLGDLKVAAPDSDKIEQQARQFLKSLHEKHAPVRHGIIPGEEEHPKRKFVTRSSHAAVGQTLSVLYNSDVGHGHVPFHKSTFEKSDFLTIPQIKSQGLLTQEEIESLQVPDDALLAIFADFLVNYAGIWVNLHFYPRV